VQRWTELVREHPSVHGERYWPAYVTVAVAIVVQLVIPMADRPAPPWSLPAVEAALLATLAGGRFLHPRRREPSIMLVLRGLTIGLIAVTSFGNLVALVVLVDELLGGVETDGRGLVLCAIGIWVTNVIVFALWFWELDGGGPVSRRADPRAGIDFLFPQTAMGPDERRAASPAGGSDWYPDFVDYLYVSYTNATAFSPTDTMPLSRWAKLLMLVQSLAALLTVALIAARAVNILD
jgi:hypothetical protein